MLAPDVDQDLVRERFETYIVDHYTGLYNTVVSVVLAVAAAVPAQLATAKLGSDPRSCA